MASSYDPSTGILTLSGVASLADYETALEAIRFSSAGDNPNFNGGDTLHRSPTSDGTATDNRPRIADHCQSPVNDAPALNLDADSSTIGGVDYLTTFTGSSAVGIVDTDVSILDTDSPSLVSATITLTNPHGGDSLTVDTPPLPGASRRASATPSPAAIQRP